MFLKTTNPEAKMTTRVFFDVTADGAPVGKVIMEVCIVKAYHVIEIQSGWVEALMAAIANVKRKCVDS